jgi:DNA-binding GntR family transcriptional regulator
LLALNRRLWFVFFRIQGPHAQFMLSHEPIVRAIEARDTDIAEAAAVAHVRESNTLLLSMFHEVQSPRGSSYSPLGTGTSDPHATEVQTAR